MSLSPLVPDSSHCSPLSPLPFPLSSPGGHIRVPGGHIWGDLPRKVDTFGRKWDTSGQKLDTWPKTRWTLGRANGRSAIQTAPAPKAPSGTPQPTTPSPPALPFVITRCTIGAHAHSRPLGASRSHAPRPPAIPPFQPALSPHASHARTPPRPRPAISAPALAHPLSLSPSYPPINPLGPPPRPRYAGRTSPVCRPRNSRIRPKNRPKPSLASPTLKGRAGERRFPLHPPLRAQAETGDTRQTTDATAMTAAANTLERRA